MTFLKMRNGYDFMEIGSTIVLPGPNPNHRKNQSNAIYDLVVRRMKGAKG